ncbi:MAG: HNH endonuclease [Chloroflexi bacterium]|nr:HNH endonuclease [Chloroflexota bacterium]
MAGSPGLRPVLERLARLSRHDPHDPDLRMVVQARAQDACEYCLMPTVMRFEIDHVIPHGRWQNYLDGKLLVQPHLGERGPDHLDNFAWSCSFCNGTKREQTSWRVGRQRFSLFNPRRARWSEHFVFADHFLFVVGVTEIGRATERAVGFNDPRRGGPLGARHRAIVEGRYPPPWARDWGY